VAGTDSAVFQTARHALEPVRDLPEMPSLRALTCFVSTVTPPDEDSEIGRTNSLHHTFAQRCVGMQNSTALLERPASEIYFNGPTDQVASANHRKSAVWIRA
jgi:hypothetical protein